MANGKRFSDIRDFKHLLAEQQEQFARALAGKLLAYALGRHLDPLDRPHIDAILQATAAEGYPLRGMLLAVIRSPAFAAP